jgi:hypothetical protein
MSYCRWSSNHFECDVYVYEDVSGGWTTHVAGRRRKNKLPDHIKAMYPNWSELDAVDRYMSAKEAEGVWIKSQPHTIVVGKNSKGEDVPMYFLADSEYEPLPEPEAGQSYSDASPGQCADRLELLRSKGFSVPQSAIDALREEQAEIPA